MDALRAEDPVQVGPYRLVGRLGTGGMGQVYLGQGAGDTLVAVKIVHDGHAADPRFRARFAREVRTGLAVRASWSAAVVQADPDAPRPWLATEYVAGPGLDRAVAVAGALPPDAVLPLGARLATALADLHAMDVVHRDLKPSNVLLAADGPRLIDFGIAKALDATRLTHTGLAVGTPAFMSPEQATGEPEGYASDVFSLAAVLVFASTGQGPFGRTSTPVAVLSKIVNDPPELTAVPEPLRAVLADCLAKDPARRPTAAELAGRLGELAAAVPDQAWPPPVVTAEVRNAHNAARTLVDYSWSVRPRPLTPARQVAQGTPQSPWLAPAAPTGTRRGALVPVLALALVVLLGGGVAYFLTAGREDDTAPPVAAPVVPDEPPAGPPAAPKVISAPLVPSKVPGWTSAVSTTRNVAYDAPPGWKFASPGQIKGYRQPDGTAVVMSGVAEHGSLQCAGEKFPQPDAWSGVTGAPVADTGRAARGMLQLWSGIFDDGARKGRVELGPVSEVSAGERAGTRATATITKPAGSCGAQRATVTTVAFPANAGETVVYVLLADADTVSEDQVRQTIESVRPAGLQAMCDPARKPTGSWC